MKQRPQFAWPMITRIVLVCLLAGGSGAVAAPSTTNAAAASAPPRSVFAAPTKAAEGKDPFFPRSLRPYGTVAPPKVVGQQTPAPVPAELSLRGISGSAERPLAIINNYTVSPGEEREVTSGNNKLRIRCLEINTAAGAVLIQVGSERRELRLPKP